MTRKDYIQLATAISRAYQSTDSDGTLVTPAAIRAVAYRLAEVLQADNPRFDLERFLQACRLD